MHPIDAKIEELETLHRNQRKNSEHYFWNDNNEELGHYWQDQAAETNETIAELRGEKAILDKWSKINEEHLAKTVTKPNSELRADVMELADDIQADVGHGECFYEPDMLTEFLENLDKLKRTAIAYHNSNKETA